MSDTEKTTINGEGSDASACSISQIACTILTAVFILSFYWIAGGSFTERGQGVATAFALAIILPIIVYSCPTWTE
jgi:hypothetical protein